MFLDQKDRFDQVTFNMVRLRIEQKYLANELYHRLIAKESQFEEIAMAYGNGPERLPGGCLNKLTLNTPQPKLAARLKRLNAGDISTPFNVAEWILIIEMISTRPAQLDLEIEQTLLDYALQKFLIFGSKKLADQFITFSTTSSSLEESS